MLFFRAAVPSTSLRAGPSASLRAGSEAAGVIVPRTRAKRKVEMTNDRTKDQVKVEVEVEAWDS